MQVNWVFRATQFVVFVVLSSITSHAWEEKKKKGTENGSKNKNKEENEKKNPSGFIGPVNQK